jgi:hypothetical protein
LSPFALASAPAGFAAGGALEEPWSRLMTKTTTAAISSATPSQKMIRLVRGLDNEG